MLIRAMEAQTLSAVRLPEVPLTLEGASLLHQMLRVRWPEWRSLPAARRSEMVAEASIAASICAGEATGLNWRISEATAAAWGAASEVPQKW